MDTSHYTCEVCGQLYAPKTNNDGSVRKARRRICSSICKSRSRVRESRAKPVSVTKCKCCQTMFMPSKASNTHYCSLGCKDMYSSWRAGGTIRACPLPEYTSVNFSPCIVCGKTACNKGKVTGRCSWCASKPLAVAHHIAKANHSKTCAICDVQFSALYRYSARYCCSDECEMKMVRYGNAAQKAKRRARQKGGDSINPLKVFKRDGWRCHICKRLTNPSKRGTHHPRAPELEHIVSLSEGGTHTWSNVACSCRKCNGEKGAQSFGQLNLPMTG